MAGRTFRNAAGSCPVLASSAPLAPATIMIDTSHAYLYYVPGEGRAIRSQYRIHGINEPTTFGKKVSNGCVGLTNEGVIDLYGRAKLGAEVVVPRDTARRRRDDDAARGEHRWSRMSSRQPPQPGSVAAAFGIY